MGFATKRKESGEVACGCRQQSPSISIPDESATPSLFGKSNRRLRKGIGNRLFRLLNSAVKNLSQIQIDPHGSTGMTSGCRRLGLRLLQDRYVQIAPVELAQNMPKNRSLGPHEEPGRYHLVAPQEKSRRYENNRPRKPRSRGFGLLAPICPDLLLLPNSPRRVLNSEKLTETRAFCCAKS